MTPEPIVKFLDNKRLSEKLYVALDWAPAVYNAPTFPFIISGIMYSLDGNIVITLHFADGEDVRLEDPAKDFPSELLLANLNLLAGTVSGLRAGHRREIAKRVDRARERSRYSNRPW